MSRKMVRPVIDVEAFYEGETPVYEAYGKVYAQIFRDKLREEKPVPLHDMVKHDTLKSS